MWISDFAIRRPLVTVVTMLALVVFGLLALLRLKVDEFPDIQQPVIVVSVAYPGAAPEVVEREVLDPLEEAISGISGVDQIRGIAYEGFAQIIVLFSYEKNLQEASSDLRDRISAIRGQLPPEMEEPVLSRVDPQDLPILSLALFSPRRGPAELTALADPAILKELRSVPGVAQANLVGGVQPEMRVELRPEALRAAGVSLAEVVQALQLQNLAAPVGSLEDGRTTRAIRLQGRLQTPDEFAQVVVARRGNRLVRLGDVATVRLAPEEPTSLARYNGRPTVGIDLVKAKGYSTTQVVDEVLRRVDALRARLPADVRLDVIQNSGERVRRSVGNVQRSLFEGALLTVVVVFFFLASWRSTVITGLALPISVISAFTAVWAFGFTLNVMSLLGLSLAIGLLIDDAIVVRENIVRHVEMGKDHYTAAREGTAEIGLAVAATTFSIVATFVPIAFIGGVAGQWFKPFALTIAAAVLVSLVVSFSLDPMLSAYWPDPQLHRRSSRHPLMRLAYAFNRRFDRVAERYQGIVAWALDHRGATFAIAIGSLVLALVLHLAFGGTEFVPRSDRSEFRVLVETPPGTALAATEHQAERAAAALRRFREVAYTYTTVGGAGGIFSGVGSTQASIYVRLVPKHERSLSQRAVADSARAVLQRLGGAKYAVFASGFGGNYKPIQIELRGPEIGTLTLLAQEVAQEVRQVPGAVEVELSTRGARPEWEVRLDRTLASSLGLTAGQVAQAMRAAFAGLDVGDWTDPRTGQARDVRVRFVATERRRLLDLLALPLLVPTPQGPPALVPLGQIAEVRPAQGPAQIQHLDRDRVINVEANVAGRPLGAVAAEVRARVARLPLPPGYQVTQGGDVQRQAEVFRSIFVALGGAVLLMYLILVLQFGSFLDPLAILLSLPLALIGVVLALLLTGETLNIMSLIGVMMLMGLVAKNAILLIDFTKWGRERHGLPLREALIQAGRVRLRPIVMTSVALIAGMLPVALGTGEGGDFYAPLGRAVIGGVVTSTLLTLLVIPTVYEVLDGAKERALGWLRRRLHRPAAMAVAPQPGPAADD